jgi:hypothetical protein
MRGALGSKRVTIRYRRKLRHTSDAESVKVLGTGETETGHHHAAELGKGNANHFPHTKLLV